MSATLPLTDRFADACIASAARRWPADAGTSMAAEWRAELAALRLDRRLTPLRRRWGAIRFATSLAMSPSVEREGQALGWRGRAPGLGRAVLACLGVLGVATLAAVLFDIVVVTGLAVQAGIASYAAIACVAIVMALIGAAAARIRMAGQVTRSPYGTALTITAPIGIAAYLVLSVNSDLFPLNRLDLLLMVAVWTLLSIAATGTALRAARAGRRGRAWAIAIVGALVALDIASIAGGLRPAMQLHTGYAYAAAWFPLSVIYPQNAMVVTFGRADWSGTGLYSGYPSLYLLGSLNVLAGPLMLCSTFVAAYAMRLGRASVPAMAPPATTDRRPAHRSRAAQAIGASGVIIGLCTWAWVAGTRLQMHASFTIDAGLLQLRLSAISLVVVSAIVMMSGRGPVTLPGAGIFVVLFAADCIAARGRTGHVATAAILFIVGAAAVAGAGWASRRLAGTGTTDESERRSLVGVAVAGAFAISTYDCTRDPHMWAAHETGALAGPPVVVTVLGYLLAVVCG
ncbi:MAG TPA: hypothetical protein VGF84_21760 [Micromonosporaceae bacterium]